MMVDKPELLAQVVKVVRGAPWVALDTEADSLHAYPEKLCLLQLSMSGCDELVDPLAGLELAPLLAALGRHRLILHGADYDLRLLYRAYGFVPKQVFDTMLAARLAGRREVGLEKLTLAVLGVRLEKGSQRANWARRPLTERMVEYALNDTRHLKAIEEKLVAELESLGRLGWHEEVCSRLVREASRASVADPDLVWRVSGSSRLDRRGLAVLRAVWHWRDAEARRLGRPPFFIVSHDTLLRVAEAGVRGHAWSSALPRRFPSSQHAALQVVVEEALALPESDWPRHRRSTGVRLTSGQRSRYLRLQERRDRKAAELGLDPSLIASRAALIEHAGEATEVGDGLLSWQRQLLAD